MNSQEVEQIVSRFLGGQVVPFLNTEIKALSVEVNAWHIQIHAYQETSFEDEDYDLLEQKLTPVLDQLPVRVGEPWQLTLALHRHVVGSPFTPEGYRVR